MKRVFVDFFLSSTQSQSTEQSTKHRPQPPAWSCSIFTHHSTPGRRGVAVCMSADWLGATTQYTGWLIFPLKPSFKLSFRF